MAIWDQLVERAAEQHGYVTTRDARDLGINPTQLRLLAARGPLDQVGRGAYRVRVSPWREHDDLAEAVAWSLGRGVVSHESALVLHGLSDVNPSRVHLTVPRENHPRAAGGDLYRMHRRRRSRPSCRGRRLAWRSLTQAAKRQGVGFGRLQQHVAVLMVTQFLAALTDDQGAPLLLVKGGASLELRRGIPASRTSKDHDAVSRADMETVHDRLPDAGAGGWEGFTAIFTPPLPFEVPGRS